MPRRSPTKAHTDAALLNHLRERAMGGDATAASFAVAYAGVLQAQAQARLADAFGWGEEMAPTPISVLAIETGRMADAMTDPVPDEAEPAPPLEKMH